MLVRIAFSESLVEACRIQSLLEASGFHPRSVDTSSHFTVAGADRVYFVELPSAEAAAAKALLLEQGLYGAVWHPLGSST